MYTCVYIFLHIHTIICTCICMYIYSYVCIHICIHIAICVYTHKHDSWLAHLCHDFWLIQMCHNAWQIQMLRCHYSGRSGYCSKVKRLVRKCAEMVIFMFSAAPRGVSEKQYFFAKKNYNKTTIFFLSFFLGWRIPNLITHILINMISKNSSQCLWAGKIHPRANKFPSSSLPNYQGT